MDKIITLALQIENKIEDLETALFDLMGGTEVLETIGDAMVSVEQYPAMGIRWMAQKMSCDFSECQENFESLREMIYQIAPEVKFEAERIKAERIKENAST